MNVLAFDTTFGATSVAVTWRSARGEILLREAYEPRLRAIGGLSAAGGHAERLLPMIEEVMAAAQLSFARLDRIAVTVGPGSFTGVRVGVAAARGLALASQKPVVGMNSLVVMALRATVLLARDGPVEPIARPLAVVVDARRGDVFFAVFGPHGGATLVPPTVLPIAAARRALVEFGQPLVVGSGGTLLNDWDLGLGDATADAPVLQFAPFETALPDLEPHARFLAQCAPQLPILHDVAPLYLRAADAKPPGAGAVLVRSPRDDYRLDGQGNAP